MSETCWFRCWKNLLTHLCWICSGPVWDGQTARHALSSRSSSALGQRAPTVLTPSGCSSHPFALTVNRQSLRSIYLYIYKYYFIYKPNVFFLGSGKSVVISNSIQQRCPAFLRLATNVRSDAYPNPLVCCLKKLPECDEV